MIGSLFLPVLFLASDAPVGAYVEARTASVYAGACHYGGERSIAGREAVLAWSFESGSYAGVPLAGLAAIAVVAGDANLAEPTTKRASVVYVPLTARPEQRDALLAWLTSTRAEVLGDVREIHPIDVRADIGVEAYDVRAGTLVMLAGAAMPDRACCRMPFNVWYQPFEALERPLVGFDSVFQVRVDHLGVAWSRPEENAAFLGRFGTSAAHHASEGARATSGN